MAKLKEEVSSVSFKSSSIPFCFPEQILLYSHKDIITLEVPSLTKDWSSVFGSLQGKQGTEPSLHFVAGSSDILALSSDISGATLP